MRDAWLTPDGELIEVGQMQHNKFAENLLREEMGFEGMMVLLDKKHDCHPYSILHERGWIRIKFYRYAFGDDRIEILGDCIDFTKPMRNTMNPAMNSKQLRVAKRLCKKNGFEFHKAINDKRFW